MTPFADILERLRRSRGLTQTALADLVGVEPSYISALEKDRKAAPGKGVLKRLYAAMELSDAEIEAVQAAIDASPRRITLPKGLKREEYELAALLQKRLGTLSEELIVALQAMLRIQAKPNAKNDSRGKPIAKRD